MHTPQPHSRRFTASILGIALCAGAGLSACSAPNNSGPQPEVRVTQQQLGECAQEVLYVKLQNQSPAQVSTEIVSPGAFKHQYRVITLDTTGMASGTLKITGTLGSRSQGSFVLTSASPTYPCQGEGETGVSSAVNVEPGTQFTLSQTFQQGQVFRLLTEGSWQDAENTTNSVQWRFQVE